MMAQPSSLLPLILLLCLSAVWAQDGPVDVLSPSLAPRFHSAHFPDGQLRRWQSTAIAGAHQPGADGRRAISGSIGAKKAHAIMTPLSVTDFSPPSSPRHPEQVAAHDSHHTMFESETQRDHQQHKGEQWAADKLHSESADEPVEEAEIDQPADLFADEEDEQKQEEEEDKEEEEQLAHSAGVHFHHQPEGSTLGDEARPEEAEGVEHDQPNLLHEQYFDRHDRHVSVVPAQPEREYSSSGIRFVTEFAGREQPGVWLNSEGANPPDNGGPLRWDCADADCRQWARIYRALQRYVEWRDRGQTRGQDDALAKLAVRPRLLPAAVSIPGQLESESADHPRLQTQPDRPKEEMQLHVAMRLVQLSHGAYKQGRVPKPLLFPNQELVERVAGWADFMAEALREKDQRAVEEAKNVLSEVRGNETLLDGRGPADQVPVPPEAAGARVHHSPAQGSAHPESEAERRKHLASEWGKIKGQLGMELARDRKSRYAVRLRKENPVFTAELTLQEEGADGNKVVLLPPEWKDCVQTVYQMEDGGQLGDSLHQGFARANGCHDELSAGVKQLSQLERECPLPVGEQTQRADQFAQWVTLANELKMELPAFYLAPDGKTALPRVALLHNIKSAFDACLDGSPFPAYLPQKRVSGRVHNLLMGNNSPLMGEDYQKGLEKNENRNRVLRILEQAAKSKERQDQEKLNTKVEPEAVENNANHKKVLDMIKAARDEAHGIRQKEQERAEEQKRKVKENLMNADSGHAKVHAKIREFQQQEADRAAKAAKAKQHSPVVSAIVKAEKDKKGHHNFTGQRSGPGSAIHVQAHQKPNHVKHTFDPNMSELKKPESNAAKGKPKSEKLGPGHKGVKPVGHHIP